MVVAEGLRVVHLHERVAIREVEGDGVSILCDLIEEDRNLLAFMSEQLLRKPE